MPAFALVAMCALVATASAVTISTGTFQISEIGNTVQIPIVLDSAPGGISGYRIAASLSDPSVATITAVAFPDWASLKSSSDLPTDRVALQGVDLSQQLPVGATGVVLATLTVKGKATGSTSIVITPDPSMDVQDRNGNQYPVTTPPGTLTVTATPLPYAGMTIARPGFYTLDSNRDYGNWDIGILIASSDVVLDGMGYGVEGFNVEGSLGISVIGDGDAPLHNITIRNISLRYWNCGIEVNRATDFTIENVLSEWNTNGASIRGHNSNGGIVRASTVRNNLMNGVSLDYTGQITVEHCSIYSNREGMYLYEAGMGSGDGPVLLTDNLVFSNRGDGIYVGFSRGVTIRNNTIRENDGDGIEIYRCEALVEGNRIENNRWGGVGTDYNGGGSVIGNWITGNSYGISIGGMESGIGEAWNNMLNNTGDGNYGWEEMESLPCVLNTTKTAGLNIVGGPYLGGNYWANPNGAGYSQTCTDADEDGICDAPYFAGRGGTDTFTDYLPLAIPPTSPPNPLLLVPGGTHLPTDTNADRKYDDVNGNDRRDFADVVLYFNQMSWIAANEPLSAFDYNGNGRIDFADVVWLFNNL